MESPTLMPQSPVGEYDGYDLSAYEESIPCKGCGRILEEGKAFELDGKRWHIDCFRCNICDTLLDSDANLLLVGDGSLICNNCTYSCTVCDSKIEDLAILTGDQAFCAGCFRCRNCKRRIENLRYAKTSSGIFCMNCHEQVMARKKKKQKAQQQQKALNTLASPNPSHIDKSLPALPMDDMVPDPFVESSTELSPPPRQPKPKPSRAPEIPAISYGLNSGGSTPTQQQLRTPKPYNANRNSFISHIAETGGSELTMMGNGNEPYSIIPLVYDACDAPLSSSVYQRDPSPSEPKPQARPEAQRESSIPTIRTVPKEESKQDNRQYGGDRKVESPIRPHIAFQEKGRQNSLGNTSLRSDAGRLSQESARDPRYPGTAPYHSKSASTSTVTPQLSSQKEAIPTTTINGQEIDFRLQEAPKKKRSEEEDSYNSSITVRSPSMQFSADGTPRFPPRQDSARSFIPPVTPQTSRVAADSPDYSTTSSIVSQTPSGTNSSGTAATEFPDGGSIKKEGSASTLKGTEPTPSPSSRFLPSSPLSGRNRSKSGSKRHSILFAQPTRPSVPPASNRPGHSLTGSLTSIPISHISPILADPIKSPIGDLQMDEDIAKIFGDDKSAAQLLRRVSSAVRHGRSLSDLAPGSSTPMTMSPRWPRPPSYSRKNLSFDGNEIMTSPIVAAESREDENAYLKNELRLAAQKIADLESRLSNSTEKDKALDVNIQDKRVTVAVLETQRETVLREIEVLKQNKGGELGVPGNDPVRALAIELEQLRASYQREIEALVARKNQLIDETERLEERRNQAIQETEQLNSKNAQLADLNNEITRQIQGKFSANKASGLGILGEDGRPFTGSTLAASINGSALAEPMDDTGVFTAHQHRVVDLRKPMQPKKTQWYKKGGAAIVRGAGKGFKTVFSTESERQGMEGQYAQNGQDGQQDPNGQYGKDDRHFDRFFAKGKKNKTFPVNGPAPSLEMQQAHENLPGSAVPLFGSELVSRCEYEGQRIPSVVTRCIEEVELRGMDFQGIYRKTGGASQMRAIQEAFERNEELNLADETIDITAVTSVLKQYFRKLPTPLITFDIYDHILETSNQHIDDASRARIFQTLVNALPSIHRDILEFVIFHLARVADRREENLMTSRNLAVVFAPTLMWDLTGEREMNDMHSKNNAIQFLIDHNKIIFAPLPPPPQPTPVEPVQPAPQQQQAVPDAQPTTRAEGSKSPPPPPPPPRRSDTIPNAGGSVSSQGGMGSQAEAQTQLVVTPRSSEPGGSMGGSTVAPPRSELRERREEVKEVRDRDSRELGLRRSSTETS